MPGEMVQIAQFIPQKGNVIPRIFPGKMTNILNNRRDKDNIPFVVISIIGTMRSGKSFLASALIHCLEYLEKNPNAELNGWTKQNVEMSGVEWNDDCKPVTRGIWMWNQPFILALKEHKKIGVLVIDCQGLHDSRFPGKTVDSLLTLMALSLSKIHIVNMAGDTRSYDLDNLKNCTRYYRKSQQQRTMDQIFNTLILVHRDWNCDENLGERSITFVDESDENTDEHDEEGAAEAKNISTTLRAFKQVIEFMMPTPGKKILHGSVGDKRLLSDMLSEQHSKEFFRYMSDLFLLLLVRLPQEQNAHSVLTSQEELISTMNRLKDNYDTAEILIGSEEFVYEREAIIGVLDEIERLIIPEIGNAIIIRDLKDEKDLLNRLSARGPEIDGFISRRRTVITNASKAERTPEYTASINELWGKVELNADNLFSTLQSRKIKELESHKKQQRLNILNVAVPAAAGLVAGAATGGLGAVVGQTVAAAVFEAGAVGTLTAASVVVTSNFINKEEQRREKEE